MQFTCPFILASGSPRRRLLLRQLGLNFEIEVSDADESFKAGAPPSEIVEQIAVRKVLAVSRANPSALTLAADTIVVLDDEILGKPETEAEAAKMLRRLSNRHHVVYTGLALAHEESSRLVMTHEKTIVFFDEMSSEEINAYVATGSPMDKAGSYGIQDDRGALFISRIEGDYYNVVGLPLYRFYQTVKRDFKDLLLIN